VSAEPLTKHSDHRCRTLVGRIGIFVLTVAGHQGAPAQPTAYIAQDARGFGHCRQAGLHVRGPTANDLAVLNGGRAMWLSHRVRMTIKLKRAADSAPQAGDHRRTLRKFAVDYHVQARLFEHATVALGPGALLARRPGPLDRTR